MFAFLHADGMVRLRDMDGEEVVAFDAGHRSGRGTTTTSPPPASVSSSPDADVDSPEKSAAATAPEPVVVVGLTADTSEAGPILVTAGADGTARVHALTIHYRGKQVAGAGSRGGRSRRKESTGSRKEAPVGGKSDEDKGQGTSGSRPRKQREETPPRAEAQTGEAAVEDDRSTGSGRDESPGRREATKTNERGRSSGGGDKSRVPPAPPATAMGVGVAVEFKACLGATCEGSGGASRLQSTEAAEDDAGAGAGGTGAGAGETATVTSMDAFYHRS